MSDKRTFYLYSNAECPFCKKAKNLLDKEGHAYIAMELGWDHPTLDRVKRVMDWSTIPIVFEIQGRDKKFVGGYTDLVEYLQEQNNE